MGRFVRAVHQPRRHSCGRERARAVRPPHRGRGSAGGGVLLGGGGGRVPLARRGAQGGGGVGAAAVNAGEEKGMGGGGRENRMSHPIHSIHTNTM